MPKPRSQFSLPPKKKKGKVDIQPQTVNEFLEAADEFEQQGGKHRAGDAAKAARAFQRAFEVYDTGLKKFPNSFDLVYNKAVLELEVVQDSRICQHFEKDPKIFLTKTLETHTRARMLNDEDANTMFNTAQVLTIFAEMLLDSNSDPEIAQAETYFERAVELLSACLSRQETEYFSTVAAVAEMDENGGVSLNQDNTETEPNVGTSQGDNEAYATIIEPITPEALLDTAFAQLSALTSLIGAFTLSHRNGNHLASIVETANPLIQQKIPSYLFLLPQTAPEEPQATLGSTLTLSLSGVVEKSSQMSLVATQMSKTADLDLLKANFTAAMADAEYRYGLIDVPTYVSRLSSTFSSFLSKLDSTSNKEIWLNTCEAYADALTTFASTVSEISKPTDSFQTEQVCLNALNEAAQILSGITGKTPKRKAELKILQGDLDLQCRAFMLLPNAPDQLKGEAVGRLRSAATFYSQASSWRNLPLSPDEQKLWKIGVVKMAVTAVLEGERSVKMSKQHLASVKVSERVEIIKDMLDEDLITIDEAKIVEPLVSV